MLLKLAPDLAKLSKLNKINIQKTAERRKESQGSRRKVSEPKVPLGALRAEVPGQLAEIQRTDKVLDNLDRNMQDDQDASTLLSFEMFGSM